MKIKIPEKVLKNEDRKFKVDTDFIRVYQPFLRINLFESKEVPKSKQVKYMFLQHVISQRMLFTETGYQLCSPNLAKQFNVTKVTICKWLDQLIKTGILKYKSKGYLVGARSRTYLIDKKGDKGSYAAKANIVNGYNELYEVDLIKKTYVDEKRKEAINALDQFSLTYKDLLKAQKWFLGSFEAFEIAIINKIHDVVLSAPSLRNIKVTIAYDAFRAFKYGQKHFKNKDSPVAENPEPFKVRFKDTKLANFGRDIHWGYCFTNNTKTICDDMSLLASKKMLIMYNATGVCDGNLRITSLKYGNLASLADKPFKFDRLRSLSYQVFLDAHSPIK